MGKAVTKKRFSLLELMLRTLLLLYPVDFVRANRGEMLRVFRDNLDAHHRRHGYRGLLKLALLIMLDLLANAWLVRRDGLRQEAQWIGGHFDNHSANDVEGKRTMTERLNAIWQDVRFGARMLRKNPGFTGIAVLTLALGIGANAAIFSIVNGVLLRPLPYSRPEALVILAGAPSSVNGPPTRASLLNWKDQVSSYESLAVYGALGGGMNLTGGAESERVTVTEVSTNFFQTLGVSPVLGRAFLADEDQAGKNRVAVISYGLWRRLYAADTKLVGREVALNGSNFTVVGIAPAEVEFPRKADFWVPVTFGLDHKVYGFVSAHGVLGRLKPGVTLDQARAELDVFSASLKQAGPNKFAQRKIQPIPVLDRMVNSIKPTLLILFGAVGFVLLIACANVSNLLLARATSRRREVAVRAALGAGRLRIVQQLLVESLLLSGLGGTLGFLLAVGTTRLLVALQPAEIPRLSEIRLDGRVFCFTLLISLLTGVVFGLVPALSSSRVDLATALKDGSGQCAGSFRLFNFKSAFVVAEIALSLVLLVGAGLLIKSFWRLQQVNLGFQTEHVLTMALDLPDSKFPDNARKIAFYQEAIERLRTLPGVKAVGAADAPPFNNSSVYSSSFEIEGRPSAGGEDSLGITISITPDYFRAMGIPLLQGRYPSDQDRQGSAKVLLINQTMARRFWPNENAIGQHLSLNGGSALQEIIGIVADVKYYTLESKMEPEIYQPFEQSTVPPSHLVISATGDPLSLIGSVKEAVRELDKDLPLYDVMTMAGRVAESAAQRRFTLLLLVVFAALAFTLAGVGIYGVMAYAVTQRTHEVGIRMALGAQRADVLKLIVGQGLILVLTGIGVGLFASFMLTGAMKTLLFEVSATDPTTFVVIATLAAGIALLACLIPARRATKVDPLEALRYE